MQKMSLHCQILSRMHIGINIHTEGTERFGDVAMDIVSYKGADLEMFEYVLDFSDNPKAIEVIGELIDKLTDIEVRGSLEKFQTAIEHKDKTIQKEQDRKTQREM